MMTFCVFFSALYSRAVISRMETFCSSLFYLTDIFGGYYETGQVFEGFPADQAAYGCK